MQTVTINFTVSGQTLNVTSLPIKIASNTVKYVKAVFALDSDWTGFDVVSAIWYNDFAQIAVVLDENGECMIPHEVLAKPDDVMVNLVGRDIVNNELVDRLTTYPEKALDVDANAKITGTETAPVTPSQFEQYIAIVEQLVGSVKDIDHTELNADYTLTIYYKDGTSDTVGPIRGAQGETGNGILSAVLNPDYTLTLNYTNGQHDTVGPIRGAQGETGNGIQSIYLTGTSGAVKTYTILFTDGNTTEFQVTDGEVTNAVLESLMPTDTANGSIASFPDGQSVFPLKSCVVQINPIQDTSGGDPSPSNICPISGWNSVGVVDCGTNVWDEQWEQGRINHTTGAKISGNGIRSKNLIPIVPSTTYHIVVTGTYTGATSMLVLYYDRNGSFISYDNKYPLSGFNFTAPSNAYYIHINIQTTSAVTYGNDISVNYPSTDTTYHAYNGTTHTTSLGQTVYGGTLDVVSGVLTVKCGYSNLGVLNYSKSSSPQRFEATTTLPNAKAPTSSSVALNGLCTDYKIYSNDAYSGQDSAMYMSTTGLLRIYDSSRYSLSASDFKTAMNNVYLAYELATPITIQLTPTQVQTLLGTNNIFSTSGDVSVVYVADIQGYIDKKL